MNKFDPNPKLAKLIAQINALRRAKFQMECAADDTDEIDEILFEFMSKEAELTRRVAVFNFCAAASKLPACLVCTKPIKDFHYRAGDWCGTFEHEGQDQYCHVHVDSTTDEFGFQNSWRIVRPVVRCQVCSAICDAQGKCMYPKQHRVPTHILFGEMK